MNFNNFEKIHFKAYGVSVGIEFPADFSSDELIKTITDSIPLNSEIIRPTEAKQNFKIRNKKNNKLTLQKNDETKLTVENKIQLLERLESQIRLTVAEHAVSKVFIHAGVVCLKNRAIIIPARSFKGKTTLVVELVKAGATYYSDEYAVADENGFIYPFPKTLSVRGIIDDYTQLERTVEFYGGRAGSKPIRTGIILVSEFIKKSHWKPQLISQGEAVLELINNTIPIRNRPEFSLNILNKLANDAVSIKTKRGEAKRFAGKLIKFAEKIL